MAIRKKIFFIGLVLLIPLQAYAVSLGDIHISLIQGDVQVRSEGSPDWVPAFINTPLREGDQMWVPSFGRVELRLQDGTFVRLDEESSLDILGVEKDVFQFYLPRGRAYVNFRGRQGTLLQVDTPDTSIKVYDEAQFGIDGEERGTDLTVFSGEVYSETGRGRTMVNAGNTLSISEEEVEQLAPSEAPDDWEQWNLDQDKALLVQSPGTVYLPAELQGYALDFDQNGRWVFAAEYGYVWTPTVIVSAGWAPYRVGRWVWISGDYVWISYEPWGWVPYHYGRWVFIASTGWCWVPPLPRSVYWGPGFVGWVYTPTVVAWVPLAPGEIYYGYGYYGPYSVNITAINIQQIIIKKAYKSVYVNNAVTVLHRDTFVTGKEVHIHVKENPFLKERISIGRPKIKPEKATLMPVIKPIPLQAQPPKFVEDIRIQDLKQKRPLIKERPILRGEQGQPGKIRPRGMFKEQIPKIRKETGPVPPKERPALKKKQAPSGEVDTKSQELEKPQGTAPASRGERPAGEGRRVLQEEVGKRSPALTKPTEKQLQKVPVTPHGVPLMKQKEIKQEKEDVQRSYEQKEREKEKHKERGE